MIVRELITRLGFSLDQSQVARADKALDNLDNRAQTLANTLRNVALAIGGFASAKAIITIGDEMQSLRSRIGMLPQTLGDAGEAMDAVVKHANGSRAALTAYGTLYARIGNATEGLIKSQEDLLSVSDTISKALVVGGATTQEANSVMIQFAQALGSGVLQGDEFRAMAEAAPQYLKQLALHLNMPREQLKKLASEGKITTKQIIEATRKMSGYFETKFNEMPMTVGQATTIVRNKFAHMIDRMNRESLFITRIANTILGLFDKIEQGVDAVRDAFGGWNNFFRLIGAVLATALGAKAVSLLMAFRAAGFAAMLPFIKIVAILAAVALALEDIYVWINGGDSYIGKLLGPWEQWKPYVLGAIQMVTDAFMWFMSLLPGIGTMIKGLFNFDLGMIWAGLMQVSYIIGAKIFEWAKLLYDQLAAAFVRLGNYLLDVLAGWGKAIYDTFLKSIVDAVLEGWRKAKSTITGVFDTVKTVLVGGDGDSNGAPGGALGAASRAAVGVSTLPWAAPAAALAPAPSRPSVNANTTVNLTVPPGTSAEQVNYLRNAAETSFGRETDDALARAMAVYSP